MIAFWLSIMTTEMEDLETIEATYLRNRLGKTILTAALAVLLFAAVTAVASAANIYVSPDEAYTTIQGAVNHATAGDTIIVRDNTYHENVNVNKQLTIRSENGSANCIVNASNSNDHVFEVTADYVNITGFTVENATAVNYLPKAGIYLIGRQHCNISDNNASNNKDGISLWSSSSNTLTNNNASLSTRHGIFLWSSSNNTVTSNTANSNHWGGIYLDSSNDNNLTNNTASNNGDGIYMGSSNDNTVTNNTFVNNGLRVFDSFQNTVKDNKVNGKPLVYLENVSDQTIADAGQVLLVNCGNITVKNLDLSNASIGVELFGTNNSEITNNTVSNNYYDGIDLYSSSSNNLTNNNASSNNYRGIYLGSSNDNTVTNNTASNNGDGILLYSSSSNNLTNNTASNNYRGIDLYSSSSNNISCNWVQNNTDAGFYLAGDSWNGESTGNTISRNNIIANGNYNDTSGGYEWQLMNNQSDDVSTAGNWWGTANTTTINASIYDWTYDADRGDVVTNPRLDGPVSCAPPPEQYVFTTADAVIALRIAVGSHPPNSRYDASGDGNVTSLDALIILQAATT